MEKLATLLIGLFFITGNTFCLASDWVSDDLDNFRMHHQDNSPQNNNNSPVSPSNQNANNNVTPQNIDANTSNNNQLNPPCDTNLLTKTNKLKESNFFSLKSVVYQKFSHNNPKNFSIIANAMNDQTFQDSYPTKSRASSKVFEDWLKIAHPKFFTIHSDIGEHRILNIKGAWDDSEHILRSLKIPSTTIKKSDLYNMDISKYSVLIINCAGNLSRDLLPMIQRYVYNGGYLLTTDWCLQNVIERCFPQYAQWNGDLSSSGLVNARLTDASISLMVNTVPNAYWYLDDKSQIIGYLNYNKVKVLVQSSDLAKFDTNHMGVLAFTFDYGAGKVLHLVGHFDNNTNLTFRDELPDPAPRINIGLRQAIAINFIVDGLRKNGDWAIPKK